MACFCGGGEFHGYRGTEISFDVGLFLGARVDSGGNRCARDDLCGSRPATMDLLGARRPGEKDGCVYRHARWLLPELNRAITALVKSGEAAAIWKKHAADLPYRP